MDRPAIGERLPLRLGAEVPHPGPRQDLWRNEELSGALTISAIEAAEACPTGALVLKEEKHT